MMPTSNHSHRAYSRFIPSEEVGDVTQWKFGAVDGSDLVEPEPEPVAELPPEVDEAAQQALVQQACDDAYAEGFAQGQAQTALEWQQRMDGYVAQQGQEAAQRLQSVMQSLDALTCYGKRIAAWRMGFDVQHDRGNAPTAFGLECAQRFAMQLGPVEVSNRLR